MLYILQIIEFNDLNDDGFLTSSSPNVSYDTERFRWEISKVFRGDSRVVDLEMKSTNYSDENKTLNGSVYVQVIANCIHSPSIRQKESFVHFIILKTVRL